MFFGPTLTSVARALMLGIRAETSQPTRDLLN